MPDINAIEHDGYRTGWIQSRMDTEQDGHRTDDVHDHG